MKGGVEGTDTSVTVVCFGLNTNLHVIHCCVFGKHIYYCRCKEKTGNGYMGTVLSLSENKKDYSVFLAKFRQEIMFQPLHVSDLQMTFLCNPPLTLNMHNSDMLCAFTRSTLFSSDSHMYLIWFYIWEVSVAKMLMAHRGIIAGSV